MVQTHVLSISFSLRSSPPPSRARFPRLSPESGFPVVAGLLFSSTLLLPADTHAYMSAAAISRSSGLPSLHQQSSTSRRHARCNTLTIQACSSTRPASYEARTRGGVLFGRHVQARRWGALYPPSRPAPKPLSCASRRGAAVPVVAALAGRPPMNIPDWSKIRA
jgi:hypothetical protein